MQWLFNWIDDRTGYRTLVNEALYERVPGGARWRYVWGSTLVFCVMVQFITGLFLWMCYSPSSQTAWESVYYIQHEMAGGWLLRGIHHYTAQAMIVLLALHVLQVVIDGAYKAPREFNFWSGLILLQIVLGLGLTGYLLPWDQKGYWATKVATNIMSLVPFVGSDIQRLVVGGVEYGHHTLTRFFAVHAGVLPALLVVFLGVHLYFFRRQGVTVKKDKRTGPDCPFWPDQILRDVVACLAVLCVVLFLVIYHRVSDPGGHGGAPLLAPAEPSQEFSAARPEWYFLFLFQFLKYCKEDGALGIGEVWGAIYIPGLVIAFLAIIPFLGRRRAGHWLSVIVTLSLLVGAAGLTVVAIREDASKPDFREAVVQAERDARRIVELAQSPTGIPPIGAASLLRNDPKTRGPKLFARNCASCHRYDGHDGTGKLVYVDPDADVKVEAPSSAADLKGFGSREWLRGFLDPEHIATPKYYGGTAFEDGKMVGFVQDDIPDFDKAEVELVITALSAEAGLPLQRDTDARDVQRIQEGHELLGEDGFDCTSCHAFGEEKGRRNIPKLDGWGSREWMIGIVRNPAHERFYGTKNDRMPAFGEKDLLDDRKIGLIVDWLREDWYRPPEETGAEAGGEVGDNSAAPAPETVTPATGGGDDAGSAPTTPQDPSTDAPAAGEPDTDESDASDGSKEGVDTPPGDDEEESAAGTTPVADPPADAGNDDAESPPEATANVDFRKDIQPLFETYCYRCHGGKRRVRGDYNMKTRELALTPGDWGEPPIVPGKKAESYLYQLVTSDDIDERMPPEDEPELTREQIAAIGAWIDAGAAWAEDVELSLPTDGDSK